MLKRFSRRAALTALAGFSATSVFANPPSTSLRPRIRPEALSKQHVKDPATLVELAKLRGDVAYAVVETGSGKLLEHSAPDVALPPASVSKSITALYALNTLGEAYQFETKLVAKGVVNQGVLDGDLILVGGGDPTLQTDHLHQMAKDLAAQGIRKITGDFLVYAGALPYQREIDPGQPLQVGYSPAISGICLNFNRVYFDWKKTANGFQIAMDARSNAVKPPVSFAKMSLSDRKGPVFTYQQINGGDHWTVSRHALNTAGGRWLPVRAPDLYAGDVLKWLCAQQGIALPSVKKTDTYTGGDILVSHKSGPLKTIVTDMLKYSTNVTAEMIGLWSTRARGRPIDSLASSGQAMSDWANATLGLSGARFVDHSGLGDQSRLSAAGLATALSAATQQDTLRPLLKPVLMRHDNGAPDKDHPIDAKAKTGTLNFVSGLAGYMTTPQGDDFAFAIFAADLTTRAGLTQEQRERPRGAKSWNTRAKRLQQQLIERWAIVYARDS